MRSRISSLAELKDEQAWTACFEATTDERWDRLAVMVRQDIANGETVPLDFIEWNQDVP